MKIVMLDSYVLKIEQFFKIPRASVNYQYQSIHDYSIHKNWNRLSLSIDAIIQTKRMI